MATPTAFLDRVVQHRVSLELKDRREVSGELVGSDEHMNVVLEDAVETSAGGERRLGRVVVRGSTVLWLRVPAAPSGRSR